MALQFPNLSGSSLQVFRSCGRLALDDGEVNDLLRNADTDDWRRSAVTVDGHRHIVLAMFGYSESDVGHVHLDVVQPEFFARGSAPGVKSTLTEIRGIIEKLEGAELDVVYTGDFRIANSELPQIINATRMEVASGGVAFETESVRIKVSGAPIHRISWYRFDDNNTRVVIEGRKHVAISDTYLTDGLHLLKEGAAAFGLGCQ